MTQNLITKLTHKQNIIKQVKFQKYDVKYTADKI